MKEKRAYQYKDLEAAGIDTALYAPMKAAGPFTATLDAKAWGRGMNMVLFLTLEGGEKVITNVWQTTLCRNTGLPYMGMDEIPMGTKVEVAFSPNTKGKICLADIRRIAPLV